MTEYSWKLRFSCSLLPVPCSLFSVPRSLFPAPRFPFPASCSPLPVSRLKRFDFKKISQAQLLFWLGILLYLITRFIALDKFPIYFFSDEAIQTMSAYDLIQRGFRDVNGLPFPLYFENGQQFNLSLSVWLQVLIAWLPRSVWLTRGLPALLSVLFPLSAGLWAKDFFKSKHWWLLPYIITAIPAWFLHSRTAFETSLGLSFYSLFLLFYLKYRLDKRKNLVWALLFGTFAFYAYTPLQLVVVATGLVLLFVDWRYHFEDKQTVLKGFILLILLASPYFIFRITHQGSLTTHLNLLRSYWTLNLPMINKLGIFLSKWLKALNPLYWFFPNETDLIRHQMKGLAHIPWFFLPFVLLSLWKALRKWKEPAYRLVLISFLIAPMGAALVDLAITRLLVMLLPYSLLTYLGLEETLLFIETKIKVKRLPSALIALSLSAFSLWMAWIAITKGPVWYGEYGLYGMQWGGQQLSQKIENFKAEYPDSQLKLSPRWANNGDVIMRFFLGDPLPLEIVTTDEYDLYYQEIDPNLVFIITAEEYPALIQNPKFDQIEILDTLPYPDGKTGFYFLKLNYSPEAQALFEEELAERKKPEMAELELFGQNAQITYSRLDMGDIAQIFDGKQALPVRTLEANPFEITIAFQDAVELKQVSAMLGSPASRLTVRIWTSGRETPLIFTESVPSSKQIRPITIDFGRVFEVEKIKIEIESLGEGEPTHVHLWGLVLQ